MASEAETARLDTSDEESVTAFVKKVCELQGFDVDDIKDVDFAFSSTGTLFVILHRDEDTVIMEYPFDHITH